jgi:ATP-binding cassette, subfamily B (MDR/TAP), member 1
VVLHDLGAIFGKLVAQMSSEGQGFYADAGRVADEVLTLIRVVMSFSTYEREVDRYKVELAKAQKAGRKQALLQGIGMGFTMMLIFLVDGLAFWYAPKSINSYDL